VKYSHALQIATSTNIESARDWMADNIKAQGGTDINSGLLEGLQLFERTELTVPIVVFLTDGEATSGVTSSTAIRQNVLDANSMKAAIHCLAFGEYANMDLLTQISYENDGMAWKVYSNAQAEAQLEQIFESASQPLLTDVINEYTINGISVENDKIYQNSVHYYAGMEIMMTGTLQQGTDVFQLDAKISGNSDSGLQHYEKSVVQTSDKDYIGRMWAQMWVQHLTQQILVADFDDDVDALTEEAIRISLEYQLVTPYTSFVVVVPDESDEMANEPASPPTSQSNGGPYVSAYTGGSRNGGKLFSLLCLLLTCLFFLL